MAGTDIRSATKRHVTTRIAVALAGAAGLVALAATPAVAAANMSFQAPPGCTGSWNTMQSATFNHAPGTAPGCTVAEAHAP